MNKKIQKLVQKELKWYVPTLIGCWILMAMGIGLVVFGFVLTKLVRGTIWQYYFPFGMIGIIVILFAVGLIHSLSINHKFALYISPKEKRK